MKSRFLILSSLLLVVGFASAQTIMVSSELPGAEKALEGACGVAWAAVMPAVISGKRLVLTDERKTEVRCLLATIARTTFDGRDAAADQRYLNLKVDLMLGAYTPTAYDFFGSQLRQSSPRLRQGLEAALVDVGQPEGVLSYIEERRQKLAKNDALSPSAGTPALYRAFLGGRCRKAPCSQRLPESIALVRANLDVVSADLRATLQLHAPESASAVELQKLADIHKEASDLLERVERIRHDPSQDTREK